jgi:aspartyl aminopeptidase
MKCTEPGFCVTSIFYAREKKAEENVMKIIEYVDSEYDKSISRFVSCKLNLYNTTVSKTEE